MRRGLKRRKKGKELTEEEIEHNSIERRACFERLCKHVASGLSSDCFRDISWETIKAWMIKYPEEFREKEYEISLREGKDWYENVGKRQMLGTCNGNSRTWYYNMANRYGWSDRQHIESNAKVTTQVQIVNYGDTQSTKDTVQV